MTAAADLSRWKRRGTTTQRGLGYPYQQRRKALLPAALGTPCPGPWQGRPWSGKRSPRCTRIMVDPARMDLDEDPPRAIAPPERWRMCCRACNRGAGATLGNWMRRRKRRPLPIW
jgi:hypothetical protein